MLQSLIASVLLTVLINVLPRFFPKQARKAEQKIHEQIDEAFHELDREKQSGEPGKTRVKVFFPWKAMLLISVILTVLLNLVGLFVK